MATKKAAVLAREIANRLTIRFGTALTVASSIDASGNPTISINDGSAATTEQCIFIRVNADPATSLGTNSVGNTQPSYGPHVIQVVMETSLVAGSSYVTVANQLKTFGELLRFGPKVEVYLATTGAAPVVADITAANLVGSFDDLYFPFLNGA